MRQIILASSSPRRQELLKKIGLNFTVDKSNYKEDPNLHKNPIQLAKLLSFGKAHAARQKHKNALIVAADTFVLIGKETMGKPKNEKDAKNMLNRLSGKTHFVLTSITIIDTKNNKTTTRVVKTKVHMRKLSEKEIDAYVATQEPLDKAGAYGIYDKAAIFFDRIDGDFYNIVGLPLSALAKDLKKFGVFVSEYW